MRISVSNLDMDLLAGLGPLKEGAMDTVKGLVQTFVAPRFDMDLGERRAAPGSLAPFCRGLASVRRLVGGWRAELRAGTLPRAASPLPPPPLSPRHSPRPPRVLRAEMRYGADGKPTRLQAIEEVQSPVNRHPETGLPVWFCNVHNHARYLRDRRPCTVPEVGMTDVFRGDLSPIAPEDLDHINEVSRSSMTVCEMAPGDVLLVDNYRVLHGRDTFEGERYHAVSWFEGWKSDVRSVVGDGGKPGNALNKIINSLIK